jgi:multimeric flavodoxin WrbA
VKRIIGLSAGNNGGSAEILLKISLRAPQDTGVRVDLIRVDDLDLSIGPSAANDDSDWFWDQLMGGDGLIVSTSVYARTIPGKLRLLGDKIAGPRQMSPSPRRSCAKERRGSHLPSTSRSTSEFFKQEWPGS